MKVFEIGEIQKGNFSNTGVGVGFNRETLFRESFSSQFFSCAVVTVE